MAVACTRVSAQDAELTRIKQNFSQLILPTETDEFHLNATLSSLSRTERGSDQVVVELFQRYPSDPDIIRTFLTTQTAEGTWPDINYQDKKRSGWEPRIHTERILELVKLYSNPGSAYYHSAEMEKVIHKALGWWFATKPVCLNWWYNQIGVPKTLGNAFLLFEPQMTDEERRGAIEVMEHARFGMTGQNKVWLAGNVLVRALLQNDMDLVRQARDSIASEIVTGQTEGIQPDWSFHQHGTQQQFGNYGLSFLASMSFYSGVFAGTSLAFSDEQLEQGGFLVQKQNKEDKRSRSLSLTEQGEDAFELCRNLFFLWDQQILKGLTKEEEDMLKGVPANDRSILSDGSEGIPYAVMIPSLYGAMELSGISMNPSSSDPATASRDGWLQSLLPAFPSMRSWIIIMPALSAAL